MNIDILNKIPGRGKKTKIYDLSVDEIILLKDELPFNKYCIIVIQYLSLRIENNIICKSDEINKLNILYKSFNNDERTTLRYIQKLYNYIEDLISISKINSKRKKDIDNQKDLTIKKLIYIYKQTYKEKYIYLVKKFLYDRIVTKEFLSDDEIFDLEPLIKMINEDDEIRDDQKQAISKLAIRLIVFSKHSNKKNYLKRLSKLKLLSKEELYMYLETIVIHAKFCLIENDLEEIVPLFKNSIDYLDQIEDLLYSCNIDTKCYELINEYKSKINKKEKFKNNFPNFIINYDYLEEELPFIADKNIITIDEACSPDLDGAFSIEKKDDMYILEVYVTDVPAFLLKNERVMREAYKRGTSMYNNQNANRLLIRDMLPREISHDFLSLKKGKKKNVVTFTYYIDLSGNVSLENISRNSVYINDNITPTLAYNVISNQSEYNRTHHDLNVYKEACDLISNTANDRYLKEANTDKIGNIVGIPSILTNYYIGNNSSLAIYREKGIYTKESDNKYTQSVTPLRRFASDINLGIYLNELGIINCPDKYIHYVEDNLDSIIDHLNEQEKACEEFQKSYRLIKDYY